MRAPPWLFLFALGCGAAPPPEPAQAPIAIVPVEALPPPAIEWVDGDRTALADAESRASAGGRRVLESALAMVDEDVVVVGSCWDWTEEVFRRAGGETRRIFRSRPAGPFADVEGLEPGDWVSLVHTDGGGTHSAIFVSWIDREAHVALTLSYVGSRRDEAGRFAPYDLSRVFRVVRAE